MRKLMLSGFLLLAALPAWAALNVFATVPEWASLVREIGAERVSIFTATHAFQDPHRIEAKPSLLVQARRAHLVVATGADLEVGWLPLVLRESGNPAIQAGRPGYFEAAAQVALLDVPAVLDRAQGDVHASGNPHIHLDPRKLLTIAGKLTERLAALDPSGATFYRQRLSDFSQRWQAAMLRWEARASALRGVQVLSHHKSFVYLSNWLGMQEIGTLEPKPGIEPSSGQLSSLLQRQQANPARMVLVAAYQPAGPSQWFAAKAGIAVVRLPYTVGGSGEAVDLFTLFDDSIARLLKGLD